MKYYIKKKIALILAVSMSVSQTSFIFAAQTSPKENEATSQISDDNKTDIDDKDKTDDNKTDTDDKDKTDNKRDAEKDINNKATTDFKTNLTLPSELPDSYEVSENGLHAEAEGDQFFITETVSDDFVYSADVTFNNNNTDSAAALVFRKKENIEENSYMYVANLSPNGKFRLFKFEPDTGCNIAHEGNIADLGIEESNTHNLKVVCIGKKISYYIDNVLVTSTGDYFAPNYPNLFAGFGQKNIILKGNLGFLTWGVGEGADITYQNVYYGEITEGNTPQLTNLQISDGAEYKNNFKSTQYNYQQYVSNDTESIEITATAKNSAEVKITTTENGEEITGSTPLEVGQNFFTIEAITEVTPEGTPEGTDVELTAPIAYRLSVFRRYPEDSYYNEDYRGQYHYSVKDGWANDPNGLIKAPNGTYHMFYQFFPSGTKWGPMHWMHATSTDLVHWEEKPVAFYPNEYGAMYSGCAVYDAGNTSNLVEGGGFIAMITAHSEHDSGQGMILAYSKDGDNWEFYEGDKNDDGVDDGTILSWTDGKISDDDGHSRAFRDPKIFRYENKWFMVIAGGILRIYSSDDLIHWDLESTYTFPDKKEVSPNKELDAGFQVETECPDLYRLSNPDDGFKWVLSYGGRFYRIGDFEKVSGHYQFVPDPNYKGATERDHNLENVGTMNFGPDSYAAMTYYVDPSFNEDKNPDVIAFNWMNTWDNYCNAVADVKNDNFNGTFNLNLKLSLTKDASGKLVLQQTPVEAYDKIINEAENNNKFDGNIEEGMDNPFANFEGDSYLIEATFKPEPGTTDVGFHVRTGTNGEKTTINYNVADKKVTIDRSKSGKYPTEKFKEVAGQVINETPNEDGSITLHIYVDRSSVEVFSEKYTVTGAMQIFPMPTSKGLEVYSKGGKSEANIEVKEIQSIWTNKVDNPEPQSVQINKTEARLEVEKTLDLNAWLSNNPMIKTANDEQDITWSINDEDLAELEVDENNIAHVTAKGVGNVVVTATSKANDKLSAKCTIKIVENKVKTNLTWNPDNTSWYADGEFYIGQNNSNSFMFSTERSSKKDYTYKLDVEKEFNKIINVVFESQNTNAFDGCYAVQLNGEKLRLFDFKNDHTFAEVFTLKKPEDNIYHVQITVKNNTIKIDVNGSILEHTITEPDRQYSNGLFGVALYETTAKFSNLFVTYNNDSNNNSDNNQNKGNLKDVIAKISAENYIVNGTDANTQEAVKNWIEQKIKSLDLDGATVKNISISDFVAADEKKEGSFSFTVTIAKGAETASSDTLSGTITKLGSSTEEELQKVIDAIQASKYVVSGKTANTKSKVEDWLKKKIKDINITKFTIDNIDIESFTAAKSKTDGDFVFTVTLSKGEGENKITLTSKYIVGEITQLGESSSSSSSSRGGKTGSWVQSNPSESKENKNTDTTNNTPPANTINNTPSSSTNASIDKFMDVSSHWAIDSIQFVVEKGYFAGTSENSFSPDVAMTRAMVVSVLGRVANAQGSPITKFVDVDQTQYYAPFIGWALQNGIASGISETEFSPNTNVTREQLAVMFANFMKQQGYTLEATREVAFTDKDSISPWAIESVEFMVKSGILNGRTDGSFDPKGVATRAEVATVLKLFLEKTM